jgi:hypothetical protein
MRVTLPGRHQACNRSPSHSPRRLYQHLQVETVGKSPLNLAHRISGEGEHGFGFRYSNSGHQDFLKQR